MKTRIVRTNTLEWKRRAHANNPLCHWCGVLTVLKRATRYISVSPRMPETATTDHIKCRAECSSQEEWDAEENKVIACHACNDRRAHSFNKNFPVATEAERPAKTFFPPRKMATAVSSASDDSFSCHIFIKTCVGVDMPIGYITKSGRRVMYGEQKPETDKPKVWKPVGHTYY